jgi:hypothetical protein
MVEIRSMEGAAGKMPEDTKDLDNLKSIDHAVVAKPHTLVYKMHRYFARGHGASFALSSSTTPIREV